MLRHVHISENDRGTPGTGHVAWDETFRTLKEVKYDGWMTVESFGRALPALAAATKVWRDLFPADEPWQKGIGFMKQQWAILTFSARVNDRGLLNTPVADLVPR